MLNSLPLFVGLRYVRARSHKFFVSFITWVSLLCVCLGVTALIVILSVMNGLEGELRERLLALSAHARIFVPASMPRHAGLAGAGRSACAQAPDVTGAAPFIEIEALAVRKPEMLPVRLRGIDPRTKARWHAVRVHRRRQSRRPDAGFRPRDRRPQHSRRCWASASAIRSRCWCPTTDADGVPEPRLREFHGGRRIRPRKSRTTTALLIAALDDVRALLPNPDARMSLHVNFRDALGAPGYCGARADCCPQGVEIRDWTVDHASYFRAIRIEKTMVAIILMLIVAVAAFYLVAMLAMVVTDKRTDIAILRTLGTSPRRVMAMFLIQGSVIAWFGVALGVLLGSVARSQRRRRRPPSSNGCSASRSSIPTCTSSRAFRRSCASSRSCGSPASPC